jgi:hypothetical protein
MGEKGPEKDAKEAEQEKKPEEAPAAPTTPAAAASAGAAVGGLSAEAKDVADMARTLAPTVSAFFALFLLPCCWNACPMIYAQHTRQGDASFKKCDVITFFV